MAPYKLERLRANQPLAVVGCALQTGAVNVGMMIAGRLLSGIASGTLLSLVPVYIAEVAPPKQRGVIVGLQGMTLAIGFCAANWIGYGGAFATGDAQWRIPLAMQLPATIALTIGALFIPFSPRWRMHLSSLSMTSDNRANHCRTVITQERYEEAKQGDYFSDR